MQSLQAAFQRAPLIDMATYHPHPDEHGKPVLLKQPSCPTPLAAWSDPDCAATVIPGGDLPRVLNGIALEAWRDAPTTDAGWNSVAGQLALDEPALKLAPGKAPAAGVVIEEADGRIWLVAPSNAFGGYTATFPKGRVDGGVNLQACAIREAFEESGLQVRITGWLADANRTLTCTRYYRAVRTGGTPANMGWESQAVHLVPRSALKAFVAHPNDLPLLEALHLPPS
jgi:8-oxo-dGTP pyrophosphatase MutT (NUDIX family)